MMKLNGQLALLILHCLIMLTACNSNTNSENTKAILDTVSLSSKRFALAYQDGGKIVATSADTINQVSFGGASNPAISPDGNKFAYTVVDSAGHTGIWIADMENKSQSQLMIPGNADQAIWSPEGDKLAFNIINDKNIPKIGLIKIDNSGFQILENPSKTKMYSPSWKNKNELLAHDLSTLYTFDISGKTIGSKPITDLIGNGFVISDHTRFFYTFDGKKVIFNAKNIALAANEAVYIVDLASKKVTLISEKNINVPYVFVTADDRIFYSGSGSATTPSKIYVSDLNRSIKTLIDKGTNPTAALK